MVRDNVRATRVSEELRGEERLTRTIPNFISRPGRRGGTTASPSDLCWSRAAAVLAARESAMGEAARTVLIVDDEPLVLHTTAEILAEDGCAVFLAGGYDEALARLEA